MHEDDFLEAQYDALWEYDDRDEDDEPDEDYGYEDDDWDGVRLGDDFYPEDVFDAVGAPPF